MDGFFLLAVSPFIGSFILQFAMRGTSRFDLIRTRSACAACGIQLLIRDLIPLLSFFILRGRCRICRPPIRRLTICMEVLALAIAVLGIMILDDLPSILGILLGWLLLLLAAIDLRSYLLPDALVLTLALGAIADAALFSEPGLTAQLIAALVGGGAFWGIAAWTDHATTDDLAGGNFRHSTCNCPFAALQGDSHNADTVGNLDGSITLDRLGWRPAMPSGRGAALLLVLWDFVINRKPRSIRCGAFSCL